MRKVLGVLIVCLLFINCSAQRKYTTPKTANSKAQKAYANGMRMSFNGQPDQALSDFNKAIQLDPLFIDAYVEWANTQNQLGRLAEAEKGYEKALALDSLYDSSIYYSLGIVEFEQQKFDQANIHFQKYLSSGKTNEKRKAKAESYLMNSKFAAKAIQNPVPFNPVNIGPAINTPESEYLPTLSADGNTLIYTAVRGGQEDFYRSKKVNGQWQTGEPVVALNTTSNEGAHSISADGKLLVFTACHRKDGLGSCDIFFSEFLNNNWTRVKNIGPSINTAGWESQPSLSADGKTLFFVSEKAGGIGGKDIWVSNRQPNGIWSNPINLSKPVNSNLDEQSPFFHADGKTLYFMSNGHPGLGGFDLYFSRLQDDETWIEPVNLGFPINTMANEGALSVSLDGSTAYFATDLLKVQSGISSFENPQGKATTDIYSFQLPLQNRPMPTTYVKAIVQDAISGKALQANVEVVNMSSGRIHAKSVSDEIGEFLITLPIGKNYAMNVSKSKYLFHSEHFELSEAASLDQPFLLKISLYPIPDASQSTGNAPISKPVTLKNVFFETGSAALKDNSRIELNRLKEFLQENSEMKIQINGHTDNVGSDLDNLVLSENRSKAVFDYLVKSAIDSKRLKYKGFGESTPIADNATEEGRRQNRRTEFVMIR
jgi:outer membrane protein OmpA-like peptidoglycan-associated protein/Tol biopolymer transport system component